MKFTKGPWEVHYCGTLEIHPAGDEHGTRIIAEIPNDSKHGAGMDSANALLIASAPDLLETLTRIVALVEQEDAHLANFGEFEFAREIIRKAKEGDR